VSAFIVPGMAGETIAKRLQQKPTLACYAVVIRVVSGVSSVLLAKWCFGRKLRFLWHACM